MMTSAPIPGRVCVIGRTDFDTGIGRITSAMLELLSGFVPVAFLPTRGDLGQGFVSLPSGRPVPVVTSAEDFETVIFTDVLWNGIDDFNYLKVPDHGTRIAHLAFDSDALPREWVDVLNRHFDCVLFTSSYLEEVARSSGVTISIGSLPLALDIEPLIARTFVPPAKSRTRFGTISAFHERKGLDVLAGAFLDAFEGDDRVELVIHSNLAVGDVLGRVTRIAERSHGRITVSSGRLSEAEKNDLIDSFDVYVSASAGEGYSIGPREALALGKRLVLSDVPPHRDLEGVPGVALVADQGRVPARYQEIDGRIFGTQALMTRQDFASALITAREGLRHDTAEDSHQRKMRAAEFSSSVLAADYRRLIDPDAPVRPGRSGSAFTHLPDEFVERARTAAGAGGRGVSRRRIVVPAHDGGFFSLFNAFASHLVWSFQETAPPMVLPDWDASRLIQRSQGAPISSYCYSRPEDGNLWLQLFEPLYGLDEGEFQDEDRLYAGAELPSLRFNEDREPLLTYVHAFELYRAPWFGSFRRQYSGIIRDHVRLRPHFQSELDGLLGGIRDQFTIAVHIKHPSHAIEQPGASIAGVPEYLAEVRRVLAERGISESSDDWSVFVATDQERVTEAFDNEFGGRVIHFNDVMRISTSADSAYQQLPASQKSSEGHQLQHLMAADPSNWNVRLAWEVWRDAEAMAASDVLIHAVSNVATAVSYLGPETSMVFCDPALVSTS